MPIKRKERKLALLLAAALIFALLSGCQQGAASGTQLQPGLQLSADALATLDSLEKVDAYFYRMDYKADYALDTLLAQGAEDEQMLGAFVSKQVLDGLPFDFQAPNLGCSTFAAATPSGDYIQGRNLDIAGAQNILVHTRPTHGYASLSMVSGFTLGYVDSMPDSTLGRLFTLAAPYYPVDGINEKGLSVAILLLYAAPPVSQDAGKIPITTTMAVRMLLDKASTVEEAVTLMAGYDMHSILNSNIHFHIADANGDSAVIEYVNGEMQVIRHEGYGQVATNYFLSPDVVEEYQDGANRLETLRAALDESKGTVTVEKAWEMLESVKVVHDYDELTGIDYNTAYSILFNNTRRTMDICVNMEYGTVYRYEVGDTQ